MSKVTELREKLDAKRKELHEIFEEAGPDFDMSKVTKLGDNLDSAAKADQIQQRNTELTDIAKEIEELDGFAEMKGRVDKLGEVEAHPGHRDPDKKGREQKERKTFGQAFVESDARTKKNIDVELKDIEAKTLFSTAGGSITYTGATTGWYPMDDRTGTFVDYALARVPLKVVDMIRSSTTTAAAITYVQENTFTNAALETTEGSAKPEAALDIDVVTEAVRKIAVWIPVTDEQLADVPQVQSYLDNRLGFMVRLRLEDEVLNGNGTAPNLKGILQRTNIQTQAKGADPVPDAIYKAMTKIRVNDYSEPNGVVLHPNDWQDIRLLRTSDGIYIWGSPSDAGPERIWGLAVAQSTRISENTGLVGDFNAAELAVREGLNTRVSDNYSDYFVKNLQVVLVEMRAALLVYREAAFCKVTGI